MLGHNINQYFCKMVLGIKNYVVLFLSFFVLLASSCVGDKQKVSTPAIEVEVDEITIPEITIDRLEQDVFGMDTLHVMTATKKLQSKYGEFYAAFITGIINNGTIGDSAYEYRMKRFISDRDMREAYNNCQKVYPDVTFLQTAMTDVFKRYKHFFPTKNTPRVITMMSGFNFPSVYIDSTLAIGLEMYLGADNKFYTMLAMPKYKSRYMHKESIVPDAVRSWMFAEYPYNMDKSDFLSEMVYMGKIMFLSDALIPDVHDSLKIQYTQNQLDYCTQNEFNVWSYFVAQKMLYTTNHAEINKFTSEGPFTSAFSKEAPPRIAYWIGWQIVRQYMSNNPEVTIEQLMNMNDAQQLLAKSKYKPKK